MQLRVISWLKKFIMICREIFSHFIAIDGQDKAAALAYGTLISIVPLMVLSFGFLVGFPSFTDQFHELRKFLFRHLVPSSVTTIQKYLEVFADNATNLSATSLAFFLITAILLIFSMETVFNSIWKIKSRRRGLQAFLMYWAVLTLLPPLGGIIVAGSVYLYSLPYVSALINLGTFFLPLVLTWIGYFFLYMTMPNCKIRFSDAARGAIIAAILFELMKSAFRLYVIYFSVDAVYGALAAIPVFLLWLYLAWLITIFGAVVSYILSTHTPAARLKSGGIS